MLVLHKKSDDPSVVPLQPTNHALARIIRILRRKIIHGYYRRYRATRPANLPPFSDDRTQFAGQVAPQLRDPEMVNLHWISELVDITTFFGAVGAPVVWTLHDMNPFTGGCHYDQRCGRFSESCGACPQLGSHDRKDLSFKVWLRKKATFEAIPKNRLHIVAPSQWMAAQLSRSSLLNRFSRSIIPNAVDTKVFAPTNPLPSREGRDVPCDKSVVLFVAPSIGTTRKGFRLLVEAIAMMSDREDIFLVSVGRRSGITEVELPHLHLGSVRSDKALAEIYSLADLFVIPSVDDNLPNTVLESMACGTPVVGFETGGIPDMVRPGGTGLLADVGDPSALRNAIEILIEHPSKRRRMSRQCRHVAVEEYSLQVQAARYRGLYESLSRETSVPISQSQQ